MDLGLQRKVALVTGASRGLGQATAFSLAAEGCRLVLVARGQEALEATASNLRATGTEVLALAADVMDTVQIEQVVRQVLEHYGCIDILVHNAGGARGENAFNTSDKDWHDALDLNVLALSTFARLVAPGMAQRGGGRIIAISSIYGRESGGRTPYNALKAASISLTKSLAIQLAHQNILVNSVAPGSLLFPGSSWERRLQANPQQIAAFVENDLPMGRFGTPEEVASVVVFLASAAASFVTGACIPVDGAQSHSNI